MEYDESPQMTRSRPGVEQMFLYNGKTSTVIRRRKRHPLHGVDVTKFDEIKLSEESLSLVANLLMSLGIVENRDLSSAGKKQGGAKAQAEVDSESGDRPSISGKLSLANTVNAT